MHILRVLFYVYFIFIARRRRLLIREYIFSFHIGPIISKIKCMETIFKFNFMVYPRQLNDLDVF